MKLIVGAGLAILCIIPAAQAQQSTPLITNIEGRHTIDLNGRWQTIIDPYETGYYDYRYQPSADGYFKNAKPKSKSDLIEYDFDTSGSLKVPGDWNTQEERLLFYEGTVWYKKSFDYQRKENTRLFVYFGAANYIADVYLNGEKLGRHEGGFTPFNFEITKLVRDTGNFLIVKVDNQRRRDAVPTLITDWWNYGGLTRQVKLIETPATFVQDYFIQLQKGSRERISGWVKLNGNKLNQKVTVRIPEARISKSFTTDASGSAQITFDAALTLWSPDNPKLYDVVIEAETDQVQDQIGFRTIETRGTEILLNGRPIFLRGVCIHEEAPFRGGRAYSREDALTLLNWAKELGVNFVRLAHYPHNEFMLSEDDPLGEYVDVFGCNEYVGWYDGLPEKADRVEWKMKYQKPLIMTEFGAEAPYGNHGDPLTRWTEEYQENAYQHQVSMLKRIPFLRGTCPWILMDFRSPRRPLPGIQDFHNRKGLISDRGEKKKAFFVMQRYYQEMRGALPK